MGCAMPSRRITSTTARGHFPPGAPPDAGQWLADQQWRLLAAPASPDPTDLSSRADYGHGPADDRECGFLDRGNQHRDAAAPRSFPADEWPDLGHRVQGALWRRPA